MDSRCAKARQMLLMSQGAPGCRVVHVGQAEHEEPPEGAHIDIQLRPGGGLEGVDALPPASEDTSFGPLASFTATHGLGFNLLNLPGCRAPPQGMHRHVLTGPKRSESKALAS